MASLTTTATVLSNQVSDATTTQESTVTGTVSSNSKSLKSELSSLIDDLGTDVQTMQTACSKTETEYGTSYLLGEKDSDALKLLMKEKLRRGFVGLDKNE